MSSKKDNHRPSKVHADLPILLTREEAAEWLRISASTFDRIRSRSEHSLPAYRVGRQLRFVDKDVLEFAAKIHQETVEMGGYEEYLRKVRLATRARSGEEKKKVQGDSVRVDKQHADGEKERNYEMPQKTETGSNDVTGIALNGLQQTIAQVVELAAKTLQKDHRIEITRVGDRVVMRTIAPPALTETEEKILKHLREVAPNGVIAKELAEIAGIAPSSIPRIVSPRAPLRRYYGVQYRYGRGYFVDPA